jgi:hypothetical protein
VSRASAHSVESAPWAIAALLGAAFVYLVTLLGNGGVLPPLTTPVPGSQDGPAVEVVPRETVPDLTPELSARVVLAPAGLPPPAQAVAVGGVRAVPPAQPSPSEESTGEPTVLPPQADTEPGRGRSDEKRKSRAKTKPANGSPPNNGGGGADAPRGHGSKAGPKPGKGHAGAGRGERGKAAGQAKQGGPKKK